jgi:hypothetical protein
MSYQVGDRIRLGNHFASGAAAFTDVSGAAADPTAALLTVEKPDGTAVVYAWPTPSGSQQALVEEAAQTGRFYADVTLDQAGRWRYRLAGTGAVVAAVEGHLTVVRSLI